MDGTPTVWFAEADWGKGADASYMPYDIAERIIAAMLRSFREGRPGGEQTPDLWLEEARNRHPGT